MRNDMPKGFRIGFKIPFICWKGYSAECEIDFDAGIIFGRISGIRDVVTFQASSIAEVKQVFQDSVDDYLKCCQELGKEPNRTNTNTEVFTNG